MLPSWFLCPESEGHLLFPVLQYCLWAGLTWTAGMIDNPSCIEPGKSLFPNPQPLLPLSQAVQDECPPAPFALNSSELLSLGSVGKILTGTRKC
jgi:hypothetical protein